MVSEAYSAVLAALRFSTEAGAPKTLAGHQHARRAKASRRPRWRWRRISRGCGKSVLLIDARPAQAGVQGGEPTRRPDQAADQRRAGRATMSSQTQYRESVAAAVRADPAQSGRPAVDRAVPGDPRRGRASISTWSSSTARRCSAWPTRRCWPRRARQRLMVVESGKTRTRAALEALNRLEAAGAHVVGAMLTKSTERSGSATAMAMSRIKYGVGKRRPPRS